MSYSYGQGTLVVNKPASGLSESYGLYTFDDVDTRMLYKEFQDGVQIYNEVEWGLMDQFIRKTTKESVRVWQRNMEFVAAAEGYMETWQKARAMEIAIELHDFELGYAFTKKAIQDLTSDDLRETQSEALRADQRLLAKRFFYRCLTPGGASSSRSWWDGNMGGTTGQRAPPAWKGNTFTTAHNHFDATGSVNIALADLSALKREIREHGYAGPIFLWMNSQEVEACEVLAGWTTALTPNSIIETVATKGFDVVKQFQGFTIIQDDWVPAGYLFGIEGRIKPVTMREPVNAGARGLKLWEGPYSNYPLQEAYYSHRFDMEVCHRGAGAIRYLGASWVTPTWTF